MVQDRHSNTEEISLVECWAILMSWKKKIIIFSLAITTITAGISLLMTRYYYAEGVLLPIEVVGSTGGIGSLLGGGGGLATLLGGGEGKNGKQLMVLLKSRTLAEKIVSKHQLETVLLRDDDIKLAADASSEKIKRKMTRSATLVLQRGMEFKGNLDTDTISVSAEFDDPELSFNIVNWYIQGLQEIINKKAYTSAKRNRFFIEKQLLQNKRELLEGGILLNSFYKDGRISDVESKIDVPIDTPFDLNDSKILNSNTNFQHEKLEDLQKEKENVERKLVVKDVPQQVYFQYLNTKLNLLTQINALLTNEYEMAKIEESKNDLSFQVIDPPILPEIPSRPQRRQMVILAFALSILVGVIVAFMIEYIKMVKQSTSEANINGN
jgi:uncharacterized protein involved in exopolysaccharide biosynthesis